MLKPTLPEDETARLAALDGLNLIYSPAEERYDRITRLAMRLFRVPIALISLVTEDKQWFKSRQGLETPETEREISFCGHAILREGPLIVNDARMHPDFADNPLVTGPPKVRFYAGQPLRHRGRAVGALCVIDHAPRDFREDEIDSLASLGAMVETEFTLAALSATQLKVLEENSEGGRRGLIDPLTQSWNRIGLERMLPREISHAIRREDEICYMHLRLSPDPTDIPDLESIQIAEIIAEMARRIRVALRPYDLVARIEGAEFAVFAPACPAEISELLAERIQSRITDIDFEVTSGFQGFSVKTGLVSTQASPYIKSDQLIEIAAMALKDAANNPDRHFVRYVI